MSESVLLGQQKHPVGLYLIAIITSFFNYSLGTINSLMVLYLTSKLHLSDKSAYAIFAAFNALVFTLPILGGYMASRFGYRYAVRVGILFCVFALVISSFLHLNTFYLGMGLYAAGYGLALPALFSIPGMLYDPLDPRRASALTLFYIIMNVGFLLSAIVGGYISQHLTYQFAYLIAAVSLFVAYLLILIWGPRIKAYHEDAFEPLIKIQSWKIPFILSLSILIVAPLAYWFIRDNHYSNLIIWLAVCASIAVVFFILRNQREKVAKHRLYAFLILLVVGLFFWVIYMLEPSLLTLFISRNVDRHLYGTLVPAASYYSLDPIFVIVLGFYLSFVWRSASRRGVMPSIPFKYCSGIFLMGVGSLVLFFGIKMAGASGLTSSFWVVLAYMFFAFAELFIAPTGIAMVGRLSPKKHIGTLMGVFNLFAGFAAILASYVAKATTIPKGESVSVSNLVYAHSFLVLGLVTMAVGLLALLLVPSVKKLIG